MIRLIKAEFAKLFSTKLWLWMLLGAFGLAALGVSLTIGFDGQEGNPAPPLSTPEGQRNLFSSAGASNVWVLILGIIAVTGEFRHQTVTPTFLATPRRGRVVIAKLLGLGLAAVPFALLVMAVTFLVVTVHAGARGDAPSLTGDNLRVLSSSGLVLVVYTVIGVGLGALLRNQVGAIVGGLVYLFVVEPIIRSVPATAGAYKWMPGGGLEALTATFQGPEVLGAWQGALLLLGYGLVAALLGTFLAVRRDVS